MGQASQVGAYVLGGCVEAVPTKGALGETGHPGRTPGLWWLHQVAGSGLVVREGQVPSSAVKLQGCIAGRCRSLPSWPGPEQA